MSREGKCYEFVSFSLACGKSFAFKTAETLLSFIYTIESHLPNKYSPSPNISAQAKQIWRVVKKLEKKGWVEDRKFKRAKVWRKLAAAQNIVNNSKITTSGQSMGRTNLWYTNF